SAGDNGGGLYNLNGTLTLTNCTVSGNSAGYDGGGLWNNGTATLTDCTVSGNSAGKGGGLFNGVSLNGVDQYTITPNLASLFPNGDTNVTVSLSFNAAGPGVIMDELGQPALNTGWHDSQIEILADGTLKLRVWNLPAVSLGTASFNTWHSVVLRYDAATQTLDGFLDGVPSTTTSSGSRQAPYHSGFGPYYAIGAARTHHLGPGAYFPGLLQNIRIFNRALSNAEIEALDGGLANHGTATLANTIVAGNAAAARPDVSGGVASLGNNLIGASDGSSGWVGADLT